MADALANVAPPAALNAHGVSQVLSLLDAIASGNVDREAIQRIRQGNTVDSIIRSLGVDVGGANAQINLQEKLLEIAGRGLGNEFEDADGQSVGSGSDGGFIKSEDLAASERLGSRPPYTTDSSRTTSNVEDVLTRARISKSPLPSPSTINASSFTPTSTKVSTDQPLPHHSIPAIPDPYPLPLQFSPAVDQPLPTGDSAISIPDSPAPSQHDVLDTPWGAVNANPEVVENLIDTFFTWEHPGYSTVCKEPFLDDLKARRKRYCSEALVNAIMARTYQMMECAGTPVAEGLVENLYRRAQVMLASERSSLETQYPHIQTLTVLASIDIVSGRLDHAWELAQVSSRLVIMDALREPDTVPDEHFLSVRANTFCGTICLPCLLRVVSRRLDPMEAPLFVRLRHDEAETPEARIERGILLQQHYHASLRHCPFRTRFVWEITEIAHTFLMFHFDETSIAQGKSDLFETYPKLIDCLERATPELGTHELDPGKLYNL
ncbi:Conidial development protein fluffy [Paramyrothecium foliicola]|nr:Conidial development protein fluffy [Paramyrothecium foliicola]